MEYDDIIYFCLLIFTIVFGYFFKRIDDTNQKKWISTGVGLSIVFYVSGIHILHTLFFTLVNGYFITSVNVRQVLGLLIRISIFWSIEIIIFTSRFCLFGSFVEVFYLLYDVEKKLLKCHIYSFFFSFSYLIFFRSTVYFGIPYPPAHTNLIQMVLTLKLVGLAFEVHDSYNFEKEDRKYKDCIVPSFKDIFQYAYCYIGVLTGPYYSYETFTDYFKHDFYKYASCEKVALKRLALVPVYAFLFLVVSGYYPVQYATSDEFYTETSFWYRLWYITPVFVSFRMRIYVGLILSEAACIMAGLGAFPVETKPKSGLGPSVNYQLVKKLETEPNLKKETNFNFETVHNIDTWYTETDPSVRSSIRYWNMCVQYWMANTVYKRFPYKAWRTAATFVVSALWHGIYAGYYLCLCPVPFYLFIEDIWEKLLRKEQTGVKRIIMDVLFWIVRTQAFSYMGMAFSLLSLRNGLRYYSSVYFVYHFTSLIGLGLGLALKNLKKGNKKLVKQEEKKKN